MSITGHQLRRRRAMAKEIIELVDDKEAFIKRFKIDANKDTLEDKLTSDTARLAEIRAILIEEQSGKRPVKEDAKPEVGDEVTEENLPAILKKLKNKPAVQAFAKDAFGLELDEAMTRKEMEAEIVKALGAAE